MTRGELINSAVTNLHKHWPKGIRRTADNAQIAALAFVEYADRWIADNKPDDGWLQASRVVGLRAIGDAYRGQAHAVSMSKSSHRNGAAGTSKAAAAVLAHAPVSIDSPDTPEPTIDTIAQSDNRIRLEQLMERASLTFDLREMLALRFGLHGEAECTMATIAAHYGCSVATAQKRIERALAQLREVERA